MKPNHYEKSRLCPSVTQVRSGVLLSFAQGGSFIFGSWRMHSGGLKAEVEANSQQEGAEAELLQLTCWENV